MSDHAGIPSVQEQNAELLSLTSHELRGPLSIVQGYLGMLRRDSDGPLTERQRKMLDEAAKSCARLVALTDEVSEISKLDLGTTKLKAETVDLFPLVADVAAGVHESEDRDVRLEVRGSGAGARIQGDPARLRYAFAAFFRAILREQPSATTVVADRTLGEAGNPASAMIVIAGEQDVLRSYEVARIPLEEKKRGGIGLILPIARRVVEHHRGQVWSPKLREIPPETPDSAQRAIIVTFPLSEHSR